MARKSSNRAQNDQEILQHIGSDRIAPYLANADGHPDRALALYRWNAELSAAFWPLISLTEVCLRNAIDERLGQWCQDNGGSRDWLLHIDQAPDELKTEFGRKVQRFKNKALEAKDIRDNGSGITTVPHRRQNAPLTNSDILAQITLGEWKELIPADSANALPNPTTAERRKRFWDGAICQAFPDGEQPHHLWKELNRLRLFRNRIAHHEPIFDVKYRRHRNELLRILRSVAPVVNDRYTSTDPLPAIFDLDPLVS